MVRLMNLYLFAHKDLFTELCAMICKSNGSATPTHFMNVGNALSAMAVQKQNLIYEEAWISSARCSALFMLS